MDRSQEWDHVRRHHLYLVGYRHRHAAPNAIHAAAHVLGAHGGQLQYHGIQQMKTTLKSVLSFFVLFVMLCSLLALNAQDAKQNPGKSGTPKSGSKGSKWGGAPRSPAEPTTCGHQTVSRFHGSRGPEDSGWWRSKYLPSSPGAISRIASGLSDAPRSTSPASSLRTPASDPTAS